MPSAAGRLSHGDHVGVRRPARRQASPAAAAASRLLRHREDAGERQLRRGEAGPAQGDQDAGECGSWGARTGLSCPKKIHKIRWKARLQAPCWLTSVPTALHGVGVKLKRERLKINIANYSCRLLHIPPAAPRAQQAEERQNSAGRFDSFIQREHLENKKLGVFTESAS